MADRCYLQAGPDKLKEAKFYAAKSGKKNQSKNTSNYHTRDIYTFLRVWGLLLKFTFSCGLACVNNESEQGVTLASFASMCASSTP